MTSTLQRLSRDAPLPRGVDAIFAMALRSCSTAAVDELMAFTSQAVQRYAKVCCVCLWVRACMNVPAVSAPKPQPSEMDRLHPQTQVR